MTGLVHVVGAGLAGLSAAVKLASQGMRVSLHEATNQAGGRCRSYHDSTLDMMIDNGNHLVLSGNHATLAFLDKIGARDRLSSPPDAAIPFVDLATGERWTIQPNDGPVPWWILDPKRRVPGTRLRDYLSLLRLLRPPEGAAVGDLSDCSGTLYERLIKPFLLAALNTEPPQGSAKLAAAVIRETLAAGGRNYRPLIARDGLSHAFVEPALRFIQANDGTVHFGSRLRGLAFDASRVAALDFGEAPVPLENGDAAILAVPPVVASTLVPDLRVPTEFRAIVNGHFRITPPEPIVPITAVINGTVEWLFAFPDRLSVTISNADRLLETSREDLAARMWQEVAAVTGIAAALPPWQIVRERRATFAALPEAEAQRPKTATAWANLALAGDWTATGLPATIEGAIRSGYRAAELITNQA
jgi:squalene-associated FAD-dependent desaturase